MGQPAIENTSRFAVEPVFAPDEDGRPLLVPLVKATCSIGDGALELAEEPNLEDPAEPLESFGQRVAPAGFGFVGYDWEPRPKLAGTCDEAWSKDRRPLLPKDFDPRFYSGAAPGLTAPGHLRGDEQVAVLNASARGRLAFRLPGAPPPRVRVALARGEDARPAMALDTVIVDTDADQVLLLWRGRVPLPDSPHDVTAIHVESGAEV